MITWKTETPEPRTPRSTMDYGGVTLSISPANDHANPGELWQWASLSLGKHVVAEPSDCLSTWPREAVRMLREAIDKFEEELDNGKLET